MPEKERTGTLDEATCLAVILWQRSMKLPPDSKVTPTVLKGLGMGAQAGWSGTVDKSINAGLSDSGQRNATHPVRRALLVKATALKDPRRPRTRNSFSGAAWRWCRPT